MRKKQFFIHFYYLNDRNKKVFDFEKVSAPSVKEARQLALTNINKRISSRPIITEIQTVGWV